VLTCKTSEKADFENEWFVQWRPLVKSTWANGIQLGGKFLQTSTQKVPELLNNLLAIPAGQEYWTRANIAARNVTARDAR